jgi:hypothetical protein
LGAFSGVPTDTSSPGEGDWVESTLLTAFEAEDFFLDATGIMIAEIVETRLIGIDLNRLVRVNDDGD